MSENKISSLKKKFLRACQAGHIDQVKSLTESGNIKDWSLHRHHPSGETGLHLAAREGHIQVAKYLCEQLHPKLGGLEIGNQDSKRPLHEAAQFGRVELVLYFLSLGAEVDALRRGDWTPLMLACAGRPGKDTDDCARILLRHGAKPRLKNKDGWNCLLLACRRGGDGELVRELLDYEPGLIDQCSNNQRTALHVAAFHAHTHLLDLLLRVRPDLLEACDSAGCTALHESVKSLDISIVKELIERGANVKAVDGIKQNLLHVAASVGNVQVVEYLIAGKYVDLNAKDQFGFTALQIAQKNKQTKIVKILLSNQTESSL